MYCLIISGILLVLLIISAIYEPRRFLNVFLLMGTATLGFIGIAQLSSNIELFNSILYILVFLFVPLMMLIVCVLLVIDSVVLLRKEGKSPVNFLPILLALAIIAGLVAVIYSVVGSSSMGIWATNFIVLIGILDIYFSLTFFFLLLYSAIYSRIPKKLGCDYIIVHGCGLSKGETVTPLLKGRIDKAVEVYERSGKKAKLVLSGGQGSDEKVSEAEAMQNYLRETGFPISDTILEDKSATTYENLKNTRDMLDTGGIKHRYIFVTNNYHVFRTGLFAKKLGIKAQGVGCKTALYFWPTAFIREYIAIMMKYKWVTVAVVVLWFVFALISAS